MSRAGEPDHVVLTEFDIRPRNVALASGTVLTGFRLRPGTIIAQDVIDEIAGNTDRAEAILEDRWRPSSAMDDAIGALSQPGATVETAALDLGISVRAMQRFFVRAKLPPPEFWRLLARARRAADLLSAAGSVADIAFACGYCDQAHMTRDFTRWFGAPPAQLRKNAGIMDRLRQPGLGNWAGEQISIR